MIIDNKKLITKSLKRKDLSFNEGPNMHNDEEVKNQQQMNSFNCGKEY
jgi:hypothetical protein